MSKRYGRRPRNPDLPAEAFNNPIAAPSAMASLASNRTSASPVARSMNWREEYSEVIGDLGRTAIIFVGLVAIMVVLSFVIR